MKLIDKDDIVAEIKKRIRAIPKDETDKTTKIVYGNEVYILTELLSFLNTLKVKEVNLEEEVDKWYNNKASKEFENILYGDIEKFAKYFYELGLKAK